MSAAYYDRAGQPITSIEWAGLYTEANQRVAADQIGDAWVSTVWLGVNHNFGAGEPLIFETMIFGGELDQEQWRYSTEDEARAGHAHALDLLRAGEKERARAHYESLAAEAAEQTS